MTASAGQLGNATADAEDDSRIDDSAFRFLIERNADGILVLDPEGTTLFANPEAARIFGRPLGRLRGTQLGMPLVAGETSELVVHQPLGQRVDVELRVTETIWRGARALLVSLRDVSQRREMEARLRQNQKMEAVGRLTAGVAHDFNNLLTVVMGNLELLKHRIADDDAKLQQIVGNAREGAERAAQLTHQLLAFSRKQPLSPVLVDPRALVDRLTALLGRTLGAGIHIETSVEAGIWPIEVDATQLDTAIINLAVNGRDAMSGRGTITIAAHNVSGGETGDHVRLSVGDRGTGMSEMVRHKVFEPFFTTKGQGEGTGLGLSQVYGFVQQSGGQIEIDSTPGQGTTVSMLLRRAHGDVASDAASEVPHNTKADAARILLVEDDPGVCDFACSALAARKHHVVAVDNGAAARDLLASGETFDLLLTDLRLPGDLAGTDLVDFARERRPGIAALIVTAYAGGLLEDGRLPANVNLLSKPYSADGLCEAVDRSIAAARPCRRVLLIEDDNLVRSTIAASLSAAGYEVSCASRIVDALAMLERNADWDVVIVDIDLPDGRGDALLDRIRAIIPDAAIIVASGLVDEFLRQRYNHLKRVAVLAKPFGAREICAVLDRLKP